MTSTSRFVCYCADSKVRFPNWHLDDIRKNVCQGLPFYKEADGKQYCVLHYPSKDKIEDFERVFRERTDQGKWDFRMAWFPSRLDFENETFKHDADFSSATFSGRVRFKNCEFEGKFEFFDSKFLEDSEFPYSKFSKSTNFNSAEFKKYGDFASARFKGASFKKSQFHKAGFQSTQFHAEVDFAEATISEYANFLQTKCFSVAKFNKVLFPKTGNTNFHDAEFHRSIEFDESVFGETDFTLTKFSLSASSSSDQPTFRKARFNGTTRFSDAAFHGEADFKQATFAAVAFERARFIRGVRFTACDFLSLTYFHETQFGGRSNESIRSGHAYFDYVLFGEDSRLFFQNTWFSYLINFDYAMFKGHIYFRGSEGHPVFDSVFETQSLTSLMSFLNATIYEPERIHFNTVRLRPHWFVNVDSRKFNLTNIDWLDGDGKFITVKGELDNLTKRSYRRPEELLAIAFRQLAANAEDNARLEEASLFRRMAMETEWVRRKKQFSELVAHIYTESEKRKERSGSVEGYTPTRPTTFFGILRRSGDSFLHLLYRSTSFYGENWGRALIMLLLVLGTFAFAYTRIQFYVCPSDKPITQSSQQNLCQTRHLQANEAMRHSLASATFQNTDHRKPIDGKGEALTLLEKIFAPLQAALLALAIRRKFMR